MSLYEFYRYLFYGGAVLAIIMLIVAVIIFFVFKIPSVIGDITGSNARKAIENIRNQSENSTYKPSIPNRERKSITDKISRSDSVIQPPSEEFTGSMVTQELPKINETTVLSSNETTVLSPNETTLLSNYNVEGKQEPTTQSRAFDNFKIEYEITYVHTNEVIVWGAKNE